MTPSNRYFNKKRIFYDLIGFTNNVEVPPRGTVGVPLRADYLEDQRPAPHLCQRMPQLLAGRGK